MTKARWSLQSSSMPLKMLRFILATLALLSSSASADPVAAKPRPRPATVTVVLVQTCAGEGIPPFFLSDSIRYAGGDPVNRWDPMGLYWKVYPHRDGAIAIWHDEGDGFEPTEAQTTAVEEQYAAAAHRAGADGITVYRTETVGPQIRAASQVTWSGATTPDISFIKYAGNYYESDFDEYGGTKIGDPAGLAHFILLEQEGYYRGLGLGTMENGGAKNTITIVNQTANGWGLGSISDPAAIRAIEKWAATPQAAKWLDDNKVMAALLTVGTAVFWKVAGPAIRTQIDDMINGYTRAQTKQAIFVASRRMRDRARARAADAAAQKVTNSVGKSPLVARIQGRLNLYPKVIDARTGRHIQFPSGIVDRVPKAQRVVWNSKADRATFIAEWHRRGYARPRGGWDKYDIHHIQPREFGGTNDFWNLVPVERGTHQNLFNEFWREFTGL